jgi:hypothetical protein
MRVSWLILPAALMAAGCSSAPAEPAALAPHPVTGRVTYEGKPAAGVVVTLIPTDAPMVPQIPKNPRAITGADGTFTIGTFADADGAPAGGYQLVLSWPGEKNENAESEATEITDKLMGWYDATHSTISVRVKAEANAIPAIAVPRITAAPPKSQGVPGRN